MATSGTPADVRGAATLRVSEGETFEVVIAIPAEDDVDDIVLAEVRPGPVAGASAPIADVLAASDYRTSPPLGVAMASVNVGLQLVTRVLGNPGGFHARVNHDGVVCAGPLGRKAEELTASLDAEPVNPSDPSPKGTLRLAALDPARLAFVLDLEHPGTQDVEGCTLRDGPMSQNGPVLADLLGAPDLQASDVAASGTALLDLVTFARLIAHPSAMFGAAATPVAASGAMRGALMRIDTQAAPSSLFYAQSTLEVGVAALVAPSFEGAVDHFGVVPALPSGLTIDATTGVIRGTPSQEQSATVYVVTASNAAGSTAAQLTIDIDGAAPTSCTYPQPGAQVVGQVLTALVPTVQGGGATSFTVSPALPTGIVCNPLTGIIAGTPTTVSASATYTVTAGNAFGSVTATLTLEVQAALVAPTAPSYPATITLPTGVPAVGVVPAASAGAQVSFSVSPVLPFGLSLEASTGAIVGIPQEVTLSKSYTVTVTNPAGTATATITIATPLGAPTLIAYDDDNWVGSVLLGTIESVLPSVQGGAVDTFTCTPALPLGLSLNPDTGAITGVPLLVSVASAYTITASNAAGSAQTTVTVSVLP